MYISNIYILFSALRYLSLSGRDVASAENFSRQSSAAASAGVDPPPASDQLTGTAVFTVARQILEGSHAVPTRLKILLDRAMEGIPGEERRLILTTCGWNLEDYLRGYKLKVQSLFLLTVPL